MAKPPQKLMDRGSAFFTTAVNASGYATFLLKEGIICSEGGEQKRTLGGRGHARRCHVNQNQATGGVSASGGSRLTRCAVAHLILRLFFCSLVPL